MFKKWLRFAGVWFAVAAILIAVTPEYQGGWMPISPTKESVSIWMASLFVIISLAKLAWDSRKKL
jgi:fucose 4-O-acetylase-like acetyltransferase